VARVKHSTKTRIRQLPGNIRDVFLSFAGILLFAGFIHQSFPLVLLAIGGLVLTAAVMASPTPNTSIRALIGIGRINRKILYYAIPALALGIFLGILTRNRFELTLVPEGFTGTVFVAPLIGATEELLFRGYFQGQLRNTGKLFSILCASAFHTTYKLLVILTLAMPLQFDFFFLVFWTFVGGILFGILRELSGSTIPPVIAHASFDVLLYGGMAAAPLWVWS
jgi:membrane protease YdiL (CAAX protease family)